VAGYPLADLSIRFRLRRHGDVSARWVTGVVADNRQAIPGDLFAALPGARAHGAQFAADAVSRGAVAVLTDASGAALLGSIAVPVLVSADPRAILGPLAAEVYGQPATQMTTFAVTGTNGKTTTTHQIDHILRALGKDTGLLGTVETRWGARRIPSTLTTPEAPDLQGLLAAMRDDGVSAFVMEASSHALAQHRVDGIVFDVAGFTNLSQDHLDFHGDMAAYFDAKKKLFTPEHAQRGVVVIEDEWGLRMARETRIPVTTLATGPLWRVADITPHGTGSAFTLVDGDERTVRTSTTLPGRFNVTNAALAVAMVVESGVPFEDVAGALAAVGGLSATVPGRMEVVAPGTAGEPRVIVDFAHNTDAITLALDALRPTTTGRLILVFGATGERDATKRPAMGAAAVLGADVVIITDDDPHGEDPAPIRAALLAGALARAQVEADASSRHVDVIEAAPRDDAIRAAIAEARPGDTVLIAGRGHETIQEVAGVGIVLDDRVVARQALARKKNR
jgi:UDP-N-acetylmuramoyl-L-alanyl-D-glutamate--2,6-diaminopimelate ligase